MTRPHASLKSSVAMRGNSFIDICRRHFWFTFFITRWKLQLDYLI